MKKNLPKMDASIEGILEGKEFYATDAVSHGWIDGIKNLDEVISEMTSEINTRQSIQ
jgi:ClpP class serine protease